MVIGYLFAQLLPTVRQRPGGGSLLVLGSANVDELLRGYLTKYDCSSADLNPIGGISKTDLKAFIRWSTTHLELPILDDFIHATPTAELEPITGDYVQSDEADMGMTYDELSVFGRLRKVQKLGPWGMWERLVHDWRDRLGPREVYVKVRSFFWFYAINRHKATVITPSYRECLLSPLQALFLLSFLPHARRRMADNPRVTDAEQYRYAFSLFFFLLFPPCIPRPQLAKSLRHNIPLSKADMQPNQPRRQQIRSTPV
jgi:NH3-dependent NAD+ synthetase